MISILLPQILDTPLTFLTPMKDTNGEIQSSFEPFRTFRESTTTKLSISDHTVSVVSPTFVSCERRVNFVQYEMLRSLSR